MPELSVEEVGDVAVVRIARPERRNALTLAMVAALAAVVEEQAGAGAVAVVVTGDATVFSSGVDLGELGRGVDDAGVDDVLADAADRLRRAPVPTVAAIEGACVGGAVEIALSCDARVLADGGFFAIPATKLGLLYRPDGIAAMVGLLGRDTVSRLFLFNERLDGAQALAAGLATHRCGSGRALATALELCAGVSRETRDAVRATKELVGEITKGSTDLDHWTERRRDLLGSDARRHALERATARRPDEGTVS